MNHFKFINKILIIATLSLSSLTVFSETLELWVSPPSGSAKTISHYCIEYRELDANQVPNGEWQEISVITNEVETSLSYTVCILTGLNADTFYEIRVHAQYYNGKEDVWGQYGFSIITYISMGIINSAYVYCGPLYPSYEDHEDVDGADFGWVILDQLFYRPEEKWRLPV